MEPTAKPTLLLFRYRKGDALAAFMQAHRDQHVKCLSQFFKVIVIEEDIDYGFACDLHQADLAVFEMLSGAEFKACEKPRISNVRTHANVPKLAFINADSWCENRSGFYSDMEDLGVEMAVSICVTAPERSADLADRLFVWPNFIDPQIFIDYRQPKTIPVFLTGASYPLYPWREWIFPRLEDSYPTLSSPHFGYVVGEHSARLLHGEQYARTINSSVFVPTCGTIARELVRKHLEIPAARSCLVTERTPAVEAAGFVDMVNCVFATDDDVLEKVDYLFDNPDVLEQITTAGYDLVHSRHTMRQRDQVFQWFTLQRGLQAGQTVVQRDPFEPLAIVERDGASTWSPLACEGLDLQMLERGDLCLRSGRYPAAEAQYLEARRSIPSQPEPKLRLAIVRLHLGDPRNAVHWLGRLIEQTLGAYGASEPDPEEWALFVTATVCLGRLDWARACAGCFPSLRSPRLDRIRVVVDALSDPQPGVLQFSNASEVRRVSFHTLPTQSINEWLHDLQVVLRACGQRHFARQLSRLAWVEGGTVSEGSVAGSEPVLLDTNWEDKESSRVRALELVAEIAGRQRRVTDRSAANLTKRLMRSLLRYRVIDALRRRAIDILQRL